MKKTTYSELLQDPRWQKKRLKILEQYDWKCYRCGDGTRELHVHHLYYLRGVKPWEYKNTAMVALCWKCHELLQHATEQVHQFVAEAKIIEKIHNAILKHSKEKMISVFRGILSSDL